MNSSAGVEAINRQVHEFHIGLEFRMKVLKETRNPEEWAPYG